MARRKKNLPPPIFETAEEEDEFWQTNSPLDFAHEVLEPKERRFRYPMKVTYSVSVRLDERAAALLEQVAQQLGVRPQTLARRYIQKGVREDWQRLMKASE